MRYILIIILCLTALTPTVLSQDVPQLEIDTVYTHQFTGEDQFFAQFEGTAGEVVYLLADYTDFVIGDLVIDMRDSVGRTVGFKEEYVFEQFVVGEIPADGLYTIVIEPEENEESVDILVGTSGYLEDGIQTILTRDGFQSFFLIRAEETQAYTLEANVIDGEMGLQISILTFSEFFTQPILQLSGGAFTQSLSGVTTLNAGDTYIGVLSRPLFLGDDDTTTVEINLSADQ